MKAAIAISLTALTAALPSPVSAGDGLPFRITGENVCHAYCAMSPSIEDFNRRIQTSWCNSPACSSGYGTEIVFNIHDDGMIYNPVVGCSSLDPQYDAECLEAVCSLSPLTPFHNNSGKLQVGYGHFGRQNDPYAAEPAFASDAARKLLFNATDLKKGKALVVVHKIPLEVLTKYPGMFDKAYLLSDQNLLVITYDKESTPPAYVKKISDLYTQWGVFLRKKSITKEQILEKAKTICAEAGILKW